MLSQKTFIPSRGILVAFEAAERRKCAVGEKDGSLIAARQLKNFRKLIWGLIRIVEDSNTSLKIDDCLFIRIENALVESASERERMFLGRNHEEWS